MRPRHLLLTAWAFPPARTSGVYRAGALANAFVDAGWTVTVLAAPPDVFAEGNRLDTTLLNALDARVRVVHVPFRSPATERDLARWGAVHAQFPELWNGAAAARERFAFPEPGFASWRAPLTSAARRVHAQDPVGVALGTANPHVDFLPGWWLHRRYGVPYVMDYRDAWTFSTFTGARVGDRSMRSWERRLIDDAAQVWFVSDPIRDWHTREYPGAASRMRVVQNGYDIPLGRKTFGVPFRQASESLTFGYLGTIHLGQFPRDALLAGWRLARSKDATLASSRLVLRGYLGRDGVPEPALVRWLDEAKASDVTYEGPVPRAAIGDVYASFDALVLALPGGPGVIGGKTYEYAATGLPVVPVQEPGSATFDVMAASPVWIPVATMEPQSIADAFVRAVAVVRSQTERSRQTAVEWGAQWERKVQLEPAVRAVEQLLDQDSDRSSLRRTVS